MKLVNPLGRTASNSLLTSGKLRACMCSSATTFAGARGNDSCLHCGCECSSQFYDSGNYTRAQFKLGKS